MLYRVELAPAAQRELRRLPTQARARLAGPIQRLAQRGSTRTWRIRVGPYRVVYDIEDDTALIVILKVARRSESTYSG